MSQAVAALISGVFWGACSRNLTVAKGRWRLRSRKSGHTNVPHEWAQLQSGTGKSHLNPSRCLPGVLQSESGTYGLRP